MPNQPQASTENNFSGGLKTEFTGLNFPENACTSASNCIFSIIGDVTRRGGINYETNFALNTKSTLGSAINTYKWNNVGGDGSTQIIVTQTGGTLEFYLASSATVSNPLSRQLLATSVTVSSFLATNAIVPFDPTIECQFSDGNGYLFVFHSQCDPFYCTYDPVAHTITPHIINIQIRDFAGIPEPGVAVTTRPFTLTPDHQYNLGNQGWNKVYQSLTTTSPASIPSGASTQTFTLTSSNLPIAVGDNVAISPGIATGLFSWVPFSSGTLYTVGVVSSYVGNTLVVTIGSTGIAMTAGLHGWQVVPNLPYIGLWNNVVGNYPSNSDVWWNFRDTNVTSNTPLGGFKPSLVNSGYITLSTTQAPQGSYILNAFQQQRTAIAGIPGLTDVVTTARPSNGAFFAGRVFYTGVNSSQQATGDAPYTTWTENIYFSQIITNNPSLFGYCYQQNDPTSSTLFDLLPSDGGVITIQGSGPIYKLFPIQSGILVFAANGVWYIVGSSGLGFVATDYSVIKLSGIRSISTTSYVDVLGWPVFWNEEGIYHVTLAQEGGSVRSPDIKLDFKNLCLGTILSFYNSIPLQSKKFARGAYDPNTYVIQWIYRSTDETDVISRYQFDSMLNINTYKGPFYPYSISHSSNYPWVVGINYVAGPGGSTSPDPTLKYFTSVNSNSQVTFSEENDFTTWLDWNSAGGGLDFSSTFTTGYKLHGSAWKLWQLGYIYMYSSNAPNTSYRIRGLWDYGSSGVSGKWSTAQLITNNKPYFSNIFRKIRIRGRGLVLQLQVTSVTGMPFDLAGWSMWENISGSV